MIVENHSFVFQYVVRRGAEQKPEPLGVSLVFGTDAPSGLCYCQVGEIQNNGEVSRKNGRIQKLPEVANQQLQAYDHLLSVNGRRDYEGMSSELHCARTLHLHVLRMEATVFDVGGRFVVVIEYSGDDLEPENGYISLSPGEFVKVLPGSRQQGDENNSYREYVYGGKADGLQGWLPTAVIRTEYT